MYPIVPGKSYAGVTSQFHSEAYTDRMCSLNSKRTVYKIIIARLTTKIVLICMYTEF